jgi:glycosyltransferase 2 family protein
LLAAVIGIVVSVALLLWALRGVSPADVLTHVRAARPIPLIIAVILGTLTFPVRWIRWRVLLGPAGASPQLARPLWDAVAVGFMANNLLPLRAGELVRSYTAARLTGIRFTTVLSSIAVERIFDGLTVVGLLTIALLSSDLPRSLSIAGVSVLQVAQGGAVVSAVAFLLAILILAAPFTAEKVIRQLVPAPLDDRLVNMVEGIREGLGALRAP